MGLVPTPGGFGTPDLDGRTLRIEGDLLVDETRDATATTTIDTVRGAAAFFGEACEVAWFDGFGDELELDAGPLYVSRTASLFVGGLLELGQSAINRFAQVVPGGITEVWIWPEHFDLATEAGDGEAKASYGVSPGDHAHDEPYFYVSAWGRIDRSNRFWNDPAFNGASLAYREVREVEAVVEFFMNGHSALSE